jgi:ATP-dependent Clp protease ATP-binding subunit ClpC
MFEGFNDSANQVVEYAEKEARSLGHHHIGTEHLLVGVMSVGGIGRITLEALLGISLRAIRREVEQLVGHGPGRWTGDLPFTPGAEDVLARVRHEAWLLASLEIGTEHILLALIREGGAGVGRDALVNTGADLDRGLRPRDRAIPRHGGSGAAAARAAHSHRRICRGRPAGRARCRGLVLFGRAASTVAGSDGACTG